jgi:ElaB/YqjD/DUF883 family membrane-anchored ribosome-binding protein
MTDTTLAKDKLAADFREVMSDIDALLNATTNKAEGEASALRERIVGRLEAARSRVAAAQHEAADRARRAADVTDHYVHEKPWQAVGIAAAAGLLIGVLIGRR